jgi:minor histocompatibility antigen H13
MLIGGVMSFCYLTWKHFLINNVFGVSFCLLGIRMIALPKFKVGFIMLVGLFFYDIFWVFGSKSVFGANVMVSVATGIEAPIKLMFPREFGGCGLLRNSMLGLGDIVVPGLFICLLAKWDAHRMSEKKCESFVYLNSVMVAYILSLVTTVGIMLFFNHAQPALLYIVPYILIAAFVVAICRGELKELFAFEIVDDAEEEKTNAKEPTETKSEEKKSQ